MIADNLRMLPLWLQRVLAAACAALAVLTLVQYVLEPAVSWIGSQRQWQDRVAVVIARDRALTDLSRQLAAQQAELTQDGLWAALYRGQSEIEIQRTLHMDVSGAATRLGVALAIETQPTQREGSLQAYRVRASGSMTMEQLVQCMKDLRQQARALRVGGLWVAAPHTQPASANAVLQVSFEVVGFGLADGQQGSSS
jgi:hypothetical protein